MSHPVQVATPGQRLTEVDVFFAGLPRSSSLACPLLAAHWLILFLKLVHGACVQCELLRDDHHVHEDKRSGKVKLVTGHQPARFI
jgi:hypothetical protein